MPNPKSIKELLNTGGARLSAINAQSRDRIAVLDQVRAALPAKLADKVTTAGLEQGRLTLGVAGAAWAARLRYVSDILCMKVGALTGIDIQTVRIKVLPPRA